MTKEIKLAVKIRDKKNNKAKNILSDGFIPAVMYGSGSKNLNLKVKKYDFERVFKEAGESNLIDLIIDNEKPVKVIIKDIQKDIVKDNITHIDFYQVDMSKKITTEIPLNFIGESKAVRELGGILVKNMDSIEVECLPGNLVNNIDVDLLKLNILSDVIRISDLTLPEGITAVNEQTEVVASIVELRKVEETPEEAVEAPGEDKGETKEDKGEVKEQKEKKEDKGEDNK